MPDASSPATDSTALKAPFARGHFFLRLVTATTTAAIVESLPLLAQTPRVPIRFEFGLVRADAVMIPIIGSRGAPRSDDSARRRNGDAEPWRFWAAGESHRSRPLAVANEPSQVPSHCGHESGFKTDLPEGTWEPNVSPIGTLGIATRGAATVTAIDVLTPADALWKEATPLIGRALTGAEARQRPTPLAGRATLEFSVYQEHDAPATVLHFQARKTYQGGSPSGGPGCGEVTVMSGWILRSASGALRLQDPRTEITDCDWKGPMTTVPAAAIHDRSGRVYWFAREHGYEWEEYAVYEASALRVREVSRQEAGGC